MGGGKFMVEILEFYMNFENLIIYSILSYFKIFL